MDCERDDEPRSDSTFAYDLQLTYFSKGRRDKSSAEVSKVERKDKIEGQTEKDPLSIHDYCQSGHKLLIVARVAPPHS